MHTHGSIDAQIQSLVQAWDMADSDHLLHVLPLHHVHGLINALFCPLSVGGCVEFLNNFKHTPPIFPDTSSNDHALPLSPTTPSHATDVPLTKDINHINEKTEKVGNLELREIESKYPHPEPLNLITLLSHFQKDAFIQRIQIDPPINVFMAVPTTYHHLLTAIDQLRHQNEEERVRRGVRRMRLVVSGSSALPDPISDGWIHFVAPNDPDGGRWRLLERYGMTEFGMGMFVIIIDRILVYSIRVE